MRPRPSPALELLAALLLAATALLPSPAAAARWNGATPLPPGPLPDAQHLPADLSQPPLLPTEGSTSPTAGVPKTFLEVPDGATRDTWLDLPHAFLERRIFSIVGGFDRFFADERDLGTSRSTSFIRWRNEVGVAEDGTLDVGTTIRADLKLPYIQKRLKRFRIVLENAGRGLVDSEPKPLAGREDGARADALLRFSLLDTLRSSVDLGGGVLFDLPPGVVGRVRFRYARELGKVALARVASTGFWNSRDGFGANGSFAMERALPGRLLLRWTAGTLVSQASHGYVSATELALLATLGRTTGLTLLGSAAGASKPILAVQTWRAALRLRTSLLRTWIYGELEPEVRWPQYDSNGVRWVPPPGGHRWVPAVFFRLEIQFEEAKPT